MGYKGNPYQKLKTHRIWFTIFWEGAQNHEQEKIKIKIKNIRLRGPILDLRGPNSCFRAPKSMREPTPELNGSIKDKKSVLKF